MKLFCSVTFFLLTLVLTFQIFSQTVNKSDEILTKGGPSTRGSNEKEQLFKSMTAEILREIKQRPAKEQIKYYAEFAQTLSFINESDSLQIFKMAIETAYGPTTEYRDNKEKIHALYFLLSRNDYEFKNAAVSKKLITTILAILNEAANRKSLPDYESTLLQMAEYLLKTDVNQAYHLAVLSLKHKKPQINYDGLEFFYKFQKQSPELADDYFQRLLQIVRDSDDSKLKEKFLIFSLRHRLPSAKDTIFTDRQYVQILAIILPYFQAETAQLLKKTGRDCPITKAYRMVSKIYLQRVLPDRLPILEKAVAVCNQAEIPAWKKPNFLENIIPTSETFLAEAEKISDLSARNNLIHTAAQRASIDKNYRRAIEILDMLPEDYRNSNAGWQVERFRNTSNLIKEHFNNSKPEEIISVLENFPAKFRFYVLMDAVQGFTYSTNKSLFYDFLKQAETEFEGIEIVPFGTSPYLLYRPSVYYRLVDLYGRLGFETDALRILENFVKLQNKLSRNYSYSLPSGTKTTYMAYVNVNSRLARKHLPKISVLINEIEMDHVRIMSKLNLLNAVFQNPDLYFSGFSTSE